MNRYPLNSRTLGSGVSVPESYWAATLNIVVTTALDNFTVLTGVLIQSAVIIRVVTTTGFIRSAAISAAQTMQVNATAAANRVAFLVSAVQVRVNTFTTAIAGLLQSVTSSVFTGMDATMYATANRFMQVAQSVQELATAGFGTVRNWFASQNVVETGTVNFTSFGEYASSDRYTIVPPEDRDIEVN